MWKKIKPYVVSILIALAVGALSGFLTRGEMQSFQELNQPKLSPPAIVFPIVWGILFTLMGISAAIVWKKHSPESRSALIVYGLQLIVNFFWSLIFFNAKAYLFAFSWLIFLWILIIWMIYKFSRVSKTAAYLQIPYLLWVTFAGYLNLMIYLLN